MPLPSQPVNVRDDHWEDIVSVQYGVSRFLNFLAGLLVAIASEAVFDDGNGFLWLQEVDSRKGLWSKIFFDIGAASVDGMAVGQKRIGYFLRPIVVDRAILNGNVIFVRRKGVPLVLYLSYPPSEHINSVSEMILQRVDKGEAKPMPIAEGLGGRDDRQFFCLLIMGNGGEFVVIL